MAIILSLYGNGTGVVLLLYQKLMVDPLWGFSYVDGQRVRLGFEAAEQGGSICMVGEQVLITCVEVIGEVAVQ